MKKYNEEAKRLYEQALSAGLQDVAEEIKKKYIINKKVAQPIKKWFENLFYQSDCASILLQAYHNTDFPFLLYADYPQYQQVLKELAAKCIEDIGLENILLNSEDEAQDQYDALKIAKWNYNALNKYTKDKLLEYGFTQFNLNDMVVSTDNMDKFAVVYCPTNSERAFDTLRLMDLFRWARSNRTNERYEGMTVWIKTK